MSAPSRAPPPSTSFSSFRSVSACNRCRLRKNRCDQNLPRCQSCKKARVHCVGYDPTTKREIPRSYVFFLESRLAYLEKLLVDNSIEFRPPQPYEGESELEKVAKDRSVSFSHKSAPEPDATGVQPPVDKNTTSQEKVTVARWDTSSKVKREREGEDELVSGSASNPGREDNPEHDADNKRQSDEAKHRIDNLVSNIGMVSVQGASDPRYLGSTSGISFARVVFSAVRNSVSTNSTDRGTLKSGERQTGGSLGANNGSSSMRDSIFGLQARPTTKKAPFPDQAVAERLVNLYFEHANPQIPILHRGEFMEVFQRLYSTDQGRRSSRDLYLLNVVCAIGAGIIFNTKSDVRVHEDEPQQSHKRSPTSPSHKRQKLSFQNYQPEEYHASAVVDLETFLGSSQHSDGFGGLEELQAVLLLASFALLRPVAPGLWYIIGVAVRLAVDLGLHYEDGTGIDSISEQEETARKMKSNGVQGGKSGQDGKVRLKIGSRERGRREWVRDLRRRLWWCTYSFDRLVSTCVGRPFGITDQVITTEFPSLLDDRYITKAGFLQSPANTTSYKYVSQHYFKLRLLQSEIQQVLQHQQATMARKIGKNRNNSFMHTKLPSPFLANFDSFRSWRRDVHRRLSDWKDSAPMPQQIGVQFSVEFLEINYWQALIMLYRQSLVVPAPFASEHSLSDDVSSPSMTNIEDAEDEDDIYLNVAEAGQKVLRIYRHLHRVRLVNYTYLATHHLFMAGISFLYAIWHSPVVRSRLTLDEVDFTILAATSVLGDLMEKCPPAEACRDAFERMSKATVQMCLSTTGFGSDAAILGASGLRAPGVPVRSNPALGAMQPCEEQQFSSITARTQQQRQEQKPKQQQHARFRPQYDMGLQDISPELMNEGGHHPQPPYRDNGDHIPQRSVRANQYPSHQPQAWQSYPATQVKYDNAGSSTQQTISQRHQPQQQQQRRQHPQQRRQQQEYTYPTQLQPQQQPPYDPHKRTTTSPLTPVAPHRGDREYFPPNQFLDIVSPTHTTSPDIAIAHNQDSNASNSNNNSHNLYDPPTVSSGSDGTTDINMDIFSVPGFGDASSLVGDSGPNVVGTGLDLGFGMAIDFQHDWSEGAGYDLFDGFFFGAVGSGAGFGLGNGDVEDAGNDGGGSGNADVNANEQ
ncbi:purine utilization positive regulator [Blastomyces dermatitidis ATCC 18188]|uniref:Purine utilization positive regulator n=1 Tax=Ajellomyces dermatitidis (strain ATCC 18188 / CBS 674.68) TaxID=653446 RepID=F2T9T3_AJEDA|nr:purine utilization positive regulator [Blastomyces dermatitidis ATCC 18188]